MTEVILFSQETCGASATQREKNDELENASPDVEFREVDIQNELETAGEYDVRKTPSTLVYANEARTAESIGIVDRDELEVAIEGRPAVGRTPPTPRQHREGMTEINQCR